MTAAPQRGALTLNQLPEFSVTPPFDEFLLPERSTMSTIKSPTPDNSTVASPAVPSPSYRWLWIAAGGSASVASLVAAMAVSSVTPHNPAVASTVCLLGRLLICIVFLISGVSKIRAPAFTMGYITSVGLPLAPLGLVIGIAVELVCVPSLLLGYQARLAASVVVAYCVATATLFHRDFRDPNQLMHFFKDLAIAGGALQIVAFGAGSFSLDGA
jgi:putative oxidoreductase